jgi:thymidylate synthase
MNYKHEDGTPFTKDEFLQKLKTDREFNDEFGNKGIDQISDLIKQLKTNPDSRRLLVSAWNVADVENGSMVLPPCHYGFQVYTRELSLEERAKWLQDNKGYDLLVGNLDHDHIREVVENESPTRAISLMWNQRSVDTFLGLPFNIASYGLLLEIIAKEVNMVPDELIGNLGDVHLYSNHVEQAKEQIGREPFELPTLNIMGNILQNLGKVPFDEVLRDMTPHDFQIENYQSHPAIKAPLSN